MTEVLVDYTPQPLQAEFHRSPANEVVMGGAAGPGKSHALRFEALKWALTIPNLQVYLFRRIQPELEKNHIIPSLKQFPMQLGTYKEQKKRWEFRNGSMLHFAYAQYEKDIFSFQGSEIHVLCVDELTTFTEMMYDYLLSRLRCTIPIPKQYKHKVPGVYCGTNPGGSGHAFVKKRWVDFAEPRECKRAPEDENGMMRQYIPGLVTDNPILMREDPGYVARLKALPEPYRTAYLEGDWNIFAGQAFSFNEVDHVIDPMPVPENAPIYMTFDWGYGKPYSVCWFWVDADDRLYHFAELYGMQPGQMDVGCRHTDGEIAERILEKEEEQGISSRKVMRLCDPTCFNKKPDYKGGGQGPSTAEVFSQYGLDMHPGDPSRVLKIRQFHERLRVPRDENKRKCGLPMLLVYRSCEHFIRTIPLLQYDEKKPEDVDTDMEDHIYDSACHAMMARPMGSLIAKRKRKAKSAAGGKSRFN